MSRRPHLRLALRRSALAVASAGFVVGSIVLPARPAAALTANEKYVTKLYVDFVGRPPTSDELAWGSALLQTWSRAAYVDGLFRTTEMQAAWIRGVNQRYLVADPTSAEASAASSDLQASGDYLDVELDVMSGPAYFAQAESSNAEFVDAVYGDLLWRESDSSGATYWTGQLDTGAKTRRQVATAIVRSNESASIRVKGSSDQTACLSTTLQLADDLTAGSYCLVLDRMADSSGATYWIGRLSGSDQLPALWSGLASSTEYFTHAQA